MGTVTDAALAAKLSVRPVEGLADVHDVVELFVDVWGADPANPLVRADLVRALSHSGGYAAVARETTADGTTGAAVGASLGWLGSHDGATVLHSHITGVRPGLQGRGVGYALKQDQRRWAIDCGVEVISWTFDPLVRRNAYFNLAKLGARIVGYYPDFYGLMDDELNLGEESDRAIAEWHVAQDEPPRTDRVEFRPAELNPVSSVLLEVGPGERPVVRDDSPATGLCVVQVPEDIVDLRHRNPVVAREWRRALRDTLGAAIDAGWQATAMSREGWYLLERSQ